MAKLGTRVGRRARFFGVASFGLASALVISGCAAETTDNGGNNAAGDGEITAENPYALPADFETTMYMEFGQALNPDAPSQYHTLAMLDLIEELSEGKISIEVSSGYALHAANEVTAAVRDGVTQMAFLMPGIEPSGYDPFTWHGKALSWAIDQHRPAIGELSAFAAAIETGFDNEVFTEMYDKQGVVPLTPLSVVHSGYGLLCTEPVTSLDDVAGKITRTAGPNWQDEAQAIGFTTVAMPPLEQFEALQRGVVDCVMGPLRDWYSIDLLSVANYLTLDDEAAFVGFPAGYIANQEWWDSLPPGGQNIIWRAVSEWWIGYAQTQVNLDILAMKTVAEGPQEVNSMDDDLRDALKDFQAGVLERQLEAIPAGYDADAMEASIRLLNENFTKWFELFSDDPELGGAIPATYAEFAEWAVEQPEGRWEAPGYRDLLWETLFEPRMPNKP